MSFPSSSTPSSAPASNSSLLQVLSRLEHKRKADQEAAQDLNNALFKETLAALRSKAQQLQDDKWMYQDVQL